MATTAQQAPQPDLIQSVKFYVDKLVADPSINGMKVLLLDAVTTQTVSLVYSQTQILEHDVYLVEQIERSRAHKPMPHLKAVVFIQPTPHSITNLVNEITNPRYMEYHVFFSNVCPFESLQRIAQADEHEVVRQVQEYYAEYMAINEDFFSLNVHCLSLNANPSSNQARQLFERNVQGLLSMFLSIKRKPAQIRYSASSPVARRIAEDAFRAMQSDEIFEFRRSPGPMLIVMDRKDDPVTPLLTQWTYQAMVHELMGINNNKVNLKGRPGIRKDLEEIVLSCAQDPFFAQHRYANFGDLGTAIKQLLDEYQQLAKLNENISSIEDMQNFMERYPAFRSQSLNVSKHVALMTELARMVDSNVLLDISQLEQEIACSSDYSGHRRELFEKFDNPAIQAGDKLRLAMLFVIKYESNNAIREVKPRLIAAGIPESNAMLLDIVLEYAGESKRNPGLFNTGLIAKLGKSLTSTLNGVENVYTQHEPLVISILDSIVKGKLKDAQYPVIGSGTLGGSRPPEVVVFIVGGATFEEATRIAEFNANNPGIRVFLGGSAVQNSTSFLEDLRTSFGLGRR